MGNGLFVSNNPNLACVTIAKQFQLPYCSQMRPVSSAFCSSKTSPKEWFQRKRDLNIPIHGTVIRQKAEEITLKWTEIVYKTICGESASVSEETVSAWKNITLPPLKRHKMSNANECGLFFNFFQTTFAFKGDKCHGNKKKKERVTVLYCTNASHKNLLQKAKSLPCVYKSNMSSWMTFKIFSEFLICLHRKKPVKNRRFFFSWTNVQHALKTYTLKNVHVEFLPANSTSVLQPRQRHHPKCEAHVSKAPGVQIVAKNDNQNSLLSFLVGCHTHVGRIMGFIEPRNNCKLFWEGRFQHRARKTACSFIGHTEVKEILGVTSTFNDYVKLRRSRIYQLGQPCDINENDSEHDDDDPKPVTCSEAMQHLEAYSCYLSNVPDVTENIMKNLWELETYTAGLYGTKSKQTTLDKFFSIR
ncbi:hypothetical protein PR048_030475, partial [Dryococelus australis]